MDSAEMGDCLQVSHIDKQSASLVHSVCCYWREAK